MASHSTLLASATSLDLLPLALGLLGGLALFLYGMELMSDALKAVAGDRMRILLARLTSNRWIGAVVGALTTAVIQSSSVTTVLVVGFVSAGLMTLTQSIGVIMGANVGTTITAQIVAFKVTGASLALVAAGFATTFLSRRETTRRIGTAVLGLGLVFLGMNLMGDAMAPLKDHPPFLEVMASLENVAYGVLAGAAFTALLQSSSATTGIVIVLAGQGLLALPAGIAIVLGANVGTCVTALLAALKKPPEAVRAALVHVLFNVVGVLIWLPLVGLLADFVQSSSPAADLPRQIANAHTIFNLANVLLLLPFAGVFAWIVTALVPEAPVAGEHEVDAKYLDESLISAPGLALDRVRMEMLHMGDRTLAMLDAILPAVLDGSRRELAVVAGQDDALDRLHSRIVSYLGRVSQEPLTEAQTADLIQLLEAANDLENIGDVMATNLVQLGLERLQNGLTISMATRDVLRSFHGQVRRSLDTALTAVTQASTPAADVVVGMKAEINQMAEAAARHGAHRLVAREPHRVPSYRLETDVLESLKRIYYFARRMARTAT